MADAGGHDTRLWSERRGGTLKLTKQGFVTLLTSALHRAAQDGLFLQILEMRWRRDFGGITKSEAATQFFAMKLGDPWPVSAMTNPPLFEYREDDRIFDLLELLHRDVVSEPLAQPAEKYDREAGRRLFRKHVNPVLARRDPPLELLESSHIVARVREPFRRLVEQPLPADAPQREVSDRVDDAIQHFRRRDATDGDRRAAVRELVDVLEYLRPDVKESMLTEDERMLFRLANEFAIRHNKRETRRDFENKAWLAWAFYVYLASIRLTLELRSRT